MNTLTSIFRAGISLNEKSIFQACTLGAYSRTLFYCVALLFTSFPLHTIGAESDRNQSEKILLSIDFNHPLSQHELQILSNEHVDLAKNEGPDNSNAIIVSYVGSAHGSQRVIEVLTLGRSTESAALSYNVKFSSDFQWVKGGKLHGVSSIDPISGGKKREPGNWSARLNFEHNGGARTYIYEQSVDKKWGIGESSSTHFFKKNQWYSIEILVHLNTSKNKYGSMQVYIDRELAIEHKNIEFRKYLSKESQIGKFLFSTFHGGNSLEYSPTDKSGKPTTVHAYFDNFIIRDLSK
ncbi:Uncharacterised protein [BD1-7 clade bacterium]|uniref:Polysaccharide lyase 14 domain-containing protein n=1 Tax=BD1-7 clade bacterium TaxID=2029982 RepID=A0A5S9QX69_9GAMM|nr:Uncharacterised protein [BD1-7 clade bacterium]